MTIHVIGYGSRSRPQLDGVKFATVVAAGDHAVVGSRLAALGLTTVVAAQPQRVAVGHRQAVGVAEAAHGVAVAVDHRAQLAVSALTKFKAEC